MASVAKTCELYMHTCAVYGQLHKYGVADIQQSRVVNKIPRNLKINLIS